MTTPTTTSSATTGLSSREIIIRVETGLRRMQGGQADLAQSISTARCILDDLAAELGQQRLLRAELAALLDRLAVSVQDGMR